MKLVISFPDQSHSFVHGYEAGIISYKMQQGILVVDNNGFPIHSANIPIVRLLCQHFNYIPSFSKVSCEEDGHALSDNMGVEINFGDWVNFQSNKNLHSIN